MKASLMLTILLAAMLAIAQGVFTTHETVGRHEHRAEVAMLAWFNGAVQNFETCSKNAGATVGAITGQIITWSRPPSSPPRPMQYRPPPPAPSMVRVEGGELAFGNSAHAKVFFCVRCL